MSKEEKFSEGRRERETEKCRGERKLEKERERKLEKEREREKTKPWFEDDHTVNDHHGVGGSTTTNSG